MSLPLTGRQKESLKAMDPKAKAAARKNYASQKRPPAAKAAPPPRARAPVKRSQPANSVRVTPSLGDGSSISRWPGAFDATMMKHMPSTRATGPYVVTRVTTRLQTARVMHIFGAFRRKDTTVSAGGEWSNVFGLSDVSVGTAVNGLLNTQWLSHDMAGYGYGTTVSPSAITIQIANPEALNVTTGMSYGGVCHTQLGISGSPDTWTQWGERFVSTMRPRALTAAQLAVGPVKVSSYPIDTESLADFTELTAEPGSGGSFTWLSNYDMVGLAPIVLYNPGAADLELLVTTEWRTRFGISHPAASTHTMHAPTTTAVWNAAVATAVSLGHGVETIATGALAGRAVRAAYVAAIA